MAKLVLLPAARRDLIEIGDYIAVDNPPRAASFISEIEAKMITIAEHPTRYAARPDLAPGLRSAGHGRYRIFYVEAGEEVRIVRVLHGARDVVALVAVPPASA
ncbi:type II toxin-antitoxin system RelE/ParE family toxin [Sphingomonas naphthae]|uniref:Type II toxin-antitoxin system RelE/ParE family toxin n=1 Tax=Sphingomonas naphthae TaxID=1813468 RepID=A0ABY7TNP1_9SPHN|nr:type II toxin-antitoxin system RelE/ParE family toxin [Sphingomonas naphthae]WCT74277.1 type II toxin-antitoxin system RelE/ParE family toxin [Sphingomonas naphthae]